MKRKGKAKKQTKKQRTPIVGLNFGKSVEISYIDFEGKRLVFKDEQGEILEPVNVTVGDAYHRKFKPKIVRQLQVDPTNIILDTKHLLQNYEIILFVDTNYHKLRDFYLCVSSSILVKYEIEDGRRIGYGYPQSDFLFCASYSEKPERFGWWDIIKRFIDSSFYNENGNYGLVVDSDLKDLPKINSRQAPVWEQYLLPAGLQILYASADTGKESYLNQEIKLCDKQAKKVLPIITPLFDADKLSSILKDKLYSPICYLADKNEA
jgi:hypothetical protein